MCKLRPKDKDARAKLQECDKSVREAAFAAAILSDDAAPLSDTFRAESVTLERSYDGPHPMGELMENVEKEAELFEPGKLPREFVMVRLISNCVIKMTSVVFFVKLLNTCLNLSYSAPGCGGIL